MLLKAIKNKQSKDNVEENIDDENPDENDGSPRRKRKRQVIENLLELSGAKKRTDSRVNSDARSEAQESDVAPAQTPEPETEPTIPAPEPETEPITPALISAKKRKDSKESEGKNKVLRSTCF